MKTMQWKLQPHRNSCIKARSTEYTNTFPNSIEISVVLVTVAFVGISCTWVVPDITGQVKNTINIRATNNVARPTPTTGTADTTPTTDTGYRYYVRNYTYHGYYRYYSYYTFYRYYTATVIYYYTNYSCLLRLLFSHNSGQWLGTFWAVLHQLYYPSMQRVITVVSDRSVKCNAIFAVCDLSLQFTKTLSLICSPMWILHICIIWEQHAKVRTPNTHNIVLYAKIWFPRRKKFWILRLC